MSNSRRVGVLGGWLGASGDGLTVYRDATLLGLNPSRLLTFCLRLWTRAGSLEALSNLAAMALTAVLADFTGFSRETEPKVGCAESFVGLKEAGMVRDAPSVRFCRLLEAVTFSQSALCDADLPKVSWMRRDRPLWPDPWPDVTVPDSKATSSKECVFTLEMLSRPVSAVLAGLSTEPAVTSPLLFRLSLAGADLDPAIRWRGESLLGLPSSRYPVLFSRRTLDRGIGLPVSVERLARRLDLHADSRERPRANTSVLALSSRSAFSSASTGVVSLTNLRIDDFGVPRGVLSIPTSGLSTYSRASAASVDLLPL